MLEKWWCVIFVLLQYLTLGLRSHCGGQSRPRVESAVSSAHRVTARLAWISEHQDAAAKSLQSCPTRCDPIDGSPPGSTIPGILQARALSGFAISFSNARHSVKSESVVAQLCPTLRDPMDCSLPGSSVHGIFQARVLEWVPLPSLAPSCSLLIFPSSL